MAFLGAAALAWAAAPSPSGAQQELGSLSGIVCPGIEEDGLLCSDNLMSGNCNDFVSVADRLGTLYRAQFAEHPDSESSLKTTNWWGCGPSGLGDVKALLLRIGTARALAVLQKEPYVSLAGPSPPPPSGPSDPQLSCDDLSDPGERDACIRVRLEAALSYHQRAFARCRDLVPSGLRDDLDQSESSFAALLPMRCDADAAGLDDEDLSTFVRSRCLVQAYSENTKGMLAAHPECSTPN